MTTPWYYEFHEKGAFPRQQQLCVAVRWTKYNLEGQKLKSPTVLSALQGNPLTIRLLALDAALKHFNNVKTIDKNIKELRQEQFDKKGSARMSGTWEGESSSFNTKGAPIEIIKIEGKCFKLSYIDIQFGLYEFFTNFGSVIDRLAYEIDKLYELKIPSLSLDWRMLTSKCWLDELRGKNEVLADLLGKYRENFYTATRYRNRLIHDGIIQFEVNYLLSIKISLREKPDDDESDFNVNAIGFCEDKKKEVLMLLNESYRLMLQDYENYKEVS